MLPSDKQSFISFYSEMLISVCWIRNKFIEMNYHHSTLLHLQTPGGIYMQSVRLNPTF